MDEPKLNECCAALENRSEPHSIDGREDLSYTVCEVCGRRHFELVVDPVQVGVHVGSLRG